MLAVGAVGEGQRLGRYVLRDVLGVGGQGVVYRAEDTADGTTVAIKVLRPEWVKTPRRRPPVPQGGADARRA